MEELYFGYKKASKLNALRKKKASPKRRRASPKRRKASPKRKLTKKMLDSLSLVKLKKLAKKYKVSCYKKGTKVCVKKSTLLKRLKSSRSINKILLSASKMRKEKKHKRSPKRSPKRRRRSRFGVKREREIKYILLPEDESAANEEEERLLKSGEVDVGDMLMFHPPGQVGARECTIFRKDGRLRCKWKSLMDYEYSGSDSESDNENTNFGRRRSRFGMKTIRPNVPNLSTPMTLSSGMTYKGMLDHYKKIPSTLLSYNMQSNGGYSAPGKSVYRNKNPPVQDFRYNPRLLGTSSMPPYTNISKPKSKFGQYFR